MAKLLIPFLIIVAAIHSCDSSSEMDSNTAVKPPADTIISMDDIKPNMNVTKRLTDKNIVEYLENYSVDNPETIVLINTEYGDIKVRLYEDTPLHRANFIQLIKRGIYEDTQFSRVIKKFVIQGGSSNQTLAANKKFYLGNYMLPSEMSLNHIHKRGALAMSRPYNGNPEKKSDAFDFYIVVGDKQNEPTLNREQKEKNIKYTSKQLKIYKTLGGTPHLDMEHTVFGEVISGMNIVDKINKVPVDASDWPKDDVVINLKVVR